MGPHARAAWFGVWAAVAVVASGQSEPGPPGDQAANWPVQIRPYLELMQAARDYEAGRTRPVVVCDETFDEPGQATWRVPEGEPMAAVELTTHDGRSVLRLQTDGKRAGWLAVGPQVQGDYAIELIGCSLAEPSQPPCDLSVFGGRIGHAPGLQFGAWFNRRNLAWVGRGPQTAGGPESESGEPLRPFREVDLPVPPRIEPGRWHEVHMEVRQGRLRGWVDGQLLVDRALGVGPSFDQPAQPHVYIYGTTAALDRVRVTEFHPLPPDRDEALFARAFQGRSRAQVMRELDELSALLDDPSWTVREAAQRVLVATYPLSRGSLQRLIESGTPEQRHRACRILEP